MTDTQRELFRLQQEEIYRRQIYAQHKHNLQDAWDSMVSLRAHIAAFQNTIDEVNTEESLNAGLSSIVSLTKADSTALVPASESSSVSLSPVRRSYETFPAFGTPVTEALKHTVDKVSDWKVEGGVTLFDVLSGRGAIHRERGEKAVSFKARLLKRLAHIRYLESQLHRELEEKVEIVQQAQEQVKEFVLGVVILRSYKLCYIEHIAHTGHGC